MPKVISFAILSYNLLQRFVIGQKVALPFQPTTVEALPKRPPRELIKVVATKAGRLREWAVISDHGMKLERVVAYQKF